MVSFLKHCTSLTSILTDGSYTASYVELLRHIRELDERLLRIDIVPSQPIALLCDLSLATAVALLGLLERNQAVVLVANGSSADLPFFCTHVMSVTVDNPPPTIERLRLDIRENPKCARLASQSVAQNVFVYTSGTTSSAKLVEHDYTRLRENADGVGMRLGTHSSDRISIPVPLNHMYGLGAALLPGVLAGASLDFQISGNALRYLDRERKFEPTVTFITPSFAAALAKIRKNTRIYRTTVLAGDRVSKETFSRYTEQCGHVVQVYGSTEMGAMAATSPKDSPETRLNTVGMPLPGVQFELEIPSRQILCKHQNGAVAYVDSMGHRTIHEEWFPTKDLGEIDEFGRLSVLGRSDHMVKRDGLWTSLTDLENALVQIQGVEASAVVAAGDSARGKGLVAFCVIKSGTNWSATSLRQASFTFLRPREVPDIVQIVSSFPYLPTGKIDRQKLQTIATTLSESPPSSIGDYPEQHLL